MLTAINYHYIRENFDSKYPSIFGITPHAFKKQLHLMLNEGDFLHPNDIINDSEAILRSKNNYLLVTFDDGLKEQVNFGLTILDEINIPAIFFVNSLNFEEKKVSTVHKIHLLRSVIDARTLHKKVNEGFNIDFSELDRNKAQSIYRYDDKASAELKYILNFKLSFAEQELIVKSLFDNYFDEVSVLEELYMSHQNLIDLSKKKYLGSHTHNHYPLGLTDSETIKFELEYSKSYLENLTHSKINIVSYPYGTDETCTNEVAKIAKDCGYKLGFTTKRGNNTGDENNLLLKRFDCNDVPGGKNN
jgi:peptidoglycan/xylan/chitin deacetylase (PgdA/CDA1 family)